MASSTVRVCPCAGARRSHSVNWGRPEQAYDSRGVPEYSSLVQSSLGSPTAVPLLRHQHSLNHTDRR